MPYHIFTTTLACKPGNGCHCRGLDFWNLDPLLPDASVTVQLYLIGYWVCGSVHSTGTIYFDRFTYESNDYDHKNFKIKENFIEICKQWIVRLFRTTKELPENKRIISISEL